MSMSRKVATAFMILSIAFSLVGCGGTSGGDEPQTEPGVQETVQEDEQQGEQEQQEEQPPVEEAEADETASDVMRLGSIAGETVDDIALVTDGQGSVEYKSVDALANALINGEVDLAVVTPEVSSALYNATAGSIMAIDAVANEGEAPHAVTVVRLPYFGTNPDAVVTYVTRHQGLVEGSGNATFLRGSAMQRELTDAITDAYVEDPSSIGGSLPPDNFYFLG